MWNNSQNVIISLDFAQRQRQGAPVWRRVGDKQEQSHSYTQRKSIELLILVLKIFKDTLRLLLVIVIISNISS